jgi:hypothetical protein
MNSEPGVWTYEDCALVLIGAPFAGHNLIRLP